MTDTTQARSGRTAPVAVAVPTISVRQLLPWLLFAALLAVVGLYFVSAEEGATTGDRRQRRARVGARQPAPARLPLPLSRGR